MEEKYKELIRECSIEYEKMLEEYVIKNNLNSALDIIKIDNKVKRNLIRGGINYSKVSLLIIEIYIITLIMLLFQFVNFSEFFEYNTEKNILMMLIFLLLLIEIIYIISRFLIRKRISLAKDNRFILEFEVIKTCKKLDGIAYDLKLENEIQPYAFGTWRFLYRKKLINMKEKDILESLYFIKNKIVHSKNTDFDINFIKKIVKSSLEIAEKLEKVIR